MQCLAPISYAVSGSNFPWSVWFPFSVQFLVPFCRWLCREPVSAVEAAAARCGEVGVQSEQQAAGETLQPGNHST